MKKLTRDRVVPIISASVSWLTFAMIGSGRPSLPKFASKQKRPRQAFLARIEQLIDQILLDAAVAGQQVRDKQLGKRRFFVDHARDVRLRYSRDHAVRQCGDGRQAERLSGQAALAEEIARPQKCDYGFLALLGDDGLLDLATVNVENGIRSIALPVDNLILPIIGNVRWPPFTFERNTLGSNGSFALRFIAGRTF